MRRFPHLLFSLLALTLIPTASGAEDGEKIFSLHIKNIFSSKCIQCHGGDPEKIKGEFDLSTRELLIKGGESSDQILVPGNPESSLLMTAIRWADPDYEMPPKENDRLTEKQIAKVEQWIKLGAPWPDDATQEKYIAAERGKTVTEEGVLMVTDGLSDDWSYRRYKPEDLWAFRPVNATEPPSKEGNPIDAFVKQKMDAAGAKPAAQATPRQLIRRATLDLTGLPPTPAQVRTFLEQCEEDGVDSTYGKLIDRLLASKHYGERWGQHWLDVARYADTAGFSNDFERSNAWRYRDYVIRSFNQDKPFDQFIMEQLAGDEILESDDPELKSKFRHVRPPELTIATGFLRMGPWGTAMVPQEVARQMYLDDVVDNVGQAILSTPMSCFKCHDHKFDPLPTRDYYGLYATFATTQPAELPAEYLPEENRNGFVENKALVKKLWQIAEDDRKRIVKTREDAARPWDKETGQEYVSHEKRKNHADAEKPPRHHGLDHTDEGTLKVREQDTRIWKRRQERFEPLAQAVYSGPDYKYFSTKLRRSGAMKGYDPKSYIYLGGSFEAKGDEVKPGVISAIEPKVKVPASESGRRLALAKWAAHPRNSLSTRSIVNRVWANHFGRGISATPNNFGAKGAKPTHPELLDYLTADFVTNGWKLKRLHKLIMLSQTYRQSTAHPDLENLRQTDPNNHLLAYAMPRRLTAEEIRDGLLHITGELNPEMGGLPAMPEINMEVALQPRMIQFSIAPAHQPSPTPQQRNRRSIYTYRVRGQADPFLEIFNQPNPNKSCDLRDTAAVSPQAFTLLNSDVITDRSIALAKRLEKQHPENVSDQIVAAFELTLGRAPSDEERGQMVQYTTAMKSYHNGMKPKPPIYPTKVTRSLVEEFSGKPFEYEESLPVFEKYQPDTKAHEVNAQTRALADTCLLLFNTNEFLYVY